MGQQLTRESSTIQWGMDWFRLAIWCQHGEVVSLNMETLKRSWQTGLRMGSRWIQRWLQAKEEGLG
eukprot:3233017-Prorocentrum_lima.AAC.1